MTTDTTTAALYAQALQDTTDNPGQCVVPWGVCPEHGGTLASSADRAWCRDAGCFRSWPYDRLDAPCPESVTYPVRAYRGDGELGEYAVCDGHAMAARASITNGQVVPSVPA
ncbi:hypothetical protein ACFV8Z_54395 [Streptomyces sp. NPDC059837]|uniref:hypothetical protein n=1 Tax=unclassified Streptomyces TaxID=2593676 RepID=UPI00364D5BF2